MLLQPACILSSDMMMASIGIHISQCPSMSQMRCMVLLSSSVPPRYSRKLSSKCLVTANTYISAS